MDRNMAMAMNTRKYLPRLDWLGFALQLITLGFGGFLVARGAMAWADSSHSRRICE